MLKYKQIIDKLKTILSQELSKKITDKDVAMALEVDFNNFRKQKARNSPHYPEIMEFLAKRNISINWFFFNQLPESLVESTSSYILLKYHTSVITSAGGGAINYEIDSTPLAIDKQLLDYINSSYKYTEVVQVFGESMEPDIKDGGLVFVDKSQVDVSRPGVYLIYTQDSLYIKKVKTQGEHYYMSSINEQYNDVKLDQFQVIGKVKGAFKKI